MYLDHSYSLLIQRYAALLRVREEKKEKVTHDKQTKKVKGSLISRHTNLFRFITH